MAPRKCITLSDKVKILKEIDKGLKKKDVAKMFGIPASTLSTITKNRKTITENKLDFGSERKRKRTCKYEDLDKAVLMWIRGMRDRNLPLSGPIILEKAVEYASSLGHSEFQASVGWLEKFKKRHGLIQKTVCGESADVSVTVCDNWSLKITEILKEFSPENIFNADETGLFYKCLPNKTLAFKEDKCFGGKLSKQRITVLLCANMTGKEKLKMLVIGKSKSPRCFKGVKTLEVDYDFNKKSWMTTEIFDKWLKALDKEMIKQRRKIALLIDNCPAHSQKCGEKLQSVKIIFLPPNCTSKLQPMDLGVIKNLKVHYKRRILKEIIIGTEKGDSIQDIINLRRGIGELYKAWRFDVTEKTIYNCFKKAGFSELEDSQISDDDEDVTLADLKEKWGVLKESGGLDGNVALSDFLEVDENLIVAQYPTDSDILNNVVSTDVQSDDDDETEYNLKEKKPTRSEMMNSFDVVRRGLQMEENVPDSILHSLFKCENFYESVTVFKSKQSSISDFFV